MIVYTYNEDTKEFEEAVEIIAKLGEQHIVPHNSTITKPPQKRENTAVVFNTSTHTWELISDYRGLKGYDLRTLKPIEITEIGELPPYFSEELPVSLQELKIEKIKDIKEKYQEALNKEVKINKVPYKVLYRNLIEEVLNTSNNSETITLNFNIEGYEELRLTREEALDVLNQLTLRGKLLELRKEQIISQVKKVQTQAELKKVKITFNINKEFKALINKN